MAYRDSFHIDAPVPTVFDFFRDPSNFRGLVQGITFADVVVAEDGVGTSYSWRTRILGIPFAGTDVYTEFVPDRRITDVCSSALEGTWTYTFAADGAGTTLTVENRSRSVWAVPPLRQVLDRVAAATHRARFEQLTRLLERSPPVTPPG